MVYDETENADLIKRLHIKQKEIALESGEISSIIANLNSIQDFERNVIDPKDKTRQILIKVTPTDEGTGKKVSPGRRNIVFDETKLRAEAILSKVNK